MGKASLLSLFVFFVDSAASLASAAGGGDHHTPSFYVWVLTAFGVEEKYGVVLAGFAGLCVLFFLGFSYRVSVLGLLRSKKLEPGCRSPLVLVVNFVLDFWDKTNTEMFGKQKKQFELLIVGVFLFILINNLMGLIPGFPPATQDFGMNLGLGLVVFLFYNYSGIKEHGSGYIKQFMGPFVVLAPFFLLLESVSLKAKESGRAMWLTDSKSKKNGAKTTKGPINCFI
jgi:F-type H+-transporting ATPase subunit a